MKKQYSLLSLDSEFANGVEAGLPLHLLGHQVLLVFGQLTTDGAGLLGPQVQRLVLLTLKMKRTGLLEYLGLTFTAYESCKTFHIKSK